MGREGINEGACLYSFQSDCEGIACFGAAAIAVFAIETSQISGHNHAAPTVAWSSARRTNCLWICVSKAVVVQHGHQLRCIVLPLAG